MLNKHDLICHFNDLNKVTLDNLNSYVVANYNAFTYAMKPIKDLKIIVVKRNIGGLKVFKAIRNKVIVDKLDISYINSRDLVCVDKWNLAGVYELGVAYDTLAIFELDYKALQSILFSTEEPHILEYVVTDEAGVSVVLSINMSMYKKLSYLELKNLLTNEFDTILKSRKCSDGHKGELTFTLVDFK